MKVLKYMLGNVKLFFKKNIPYVPELLSLCAIITMYLLITQKPFGEEFKDWQYISIAITIEIISVIMRAFLRVKNIDYDIPVAYKRFTRNDGHGIVSILEDDLNDALQYLSDVEDYTERIGK